MDCRGVLRGRCKNCERCTSYCAGEEGRSCMCGCPPGRHIKASAIEECGECQTGALPGVIADLVTDFTDLSIIEATRCPQCKNKVHFDVNSGEEFEYCEAHLSYQDSCNHDPFDNQDSEDDTTEIPSLTVSTLSPPQTVPALQVPIPPSLSIQSNTSDGIQVCAIPECNKPRHVDDKGTVHECCGYRHAMELIRRKEIKQMSQPVVKGITHCLLPDCNDLTWPFMNYCGRTHADEGKKKGLIAPPHPGIHKDASLCGIPECQKPKFIDHKSGKVFDFCGRSHADEAKKRGINVATNATNGPKSSEMCILEGCYKLKRKKNDGTTYDYCTLSHAEIAKSNANDQSVPKDDTLCIIPECTRPKCKVPASGGNEMYDFCGKKHAEEAKKRGIQAILTSMCEVKKFLSKFSNLSVVNIDENDHAKPGGALYKKFMAARQNLPQTDRKTCLAFHGTSESNITSICANGYDPKRRRGQSYGRGEYFATSPNIPLGYCTGGKKLLLNELLLGQSGVHHTQHGDIIVMKNPEHDLPRFIITFK